MNILHINVCAILFNRTQDLHSPKNSGKIVATVLPSKLCSQKLYQHHLSKYVYCMQNFVRFYTIESKIELSQEFQKKIAAPLTELYVPKLHQRYF